jgi:hypothetical protein
MGSAKNFHVDGLKFSDRAFHLMLTDNQLLDGLAKPLAAGLPVALLSMEKVALRFSSLPPLLH